MAGRGPDREARRQAILQAARQVFARKGFEPATLEAVAREAGLAKGTLYLYFKNKEDLYFHTAVHVLESLQSSHPGAGGALGGRPGQGCGPSPWASSISSSVTGTPCSCSPPSPIPAWPACTNACSRP